MNYISILLLPFLLFLFSSCASHYKGPFPKKNVRDEKIKSEEMSKFRFEESFWNQPLKAFRMGPEKKVLTLESLRPLISEVSPQASDKIDSLRPYVSAQTGFFVGCIGFYTAYLIQEDPRRKSTLYNLGLGSCLLSIASGFLQSQGLYKGAQKYNQDLEKYISGP